MPLRLLVILSLWITVLTAGLYASSAASCAHKTTTTSIEAPSLADDTSSQFIIAQTTLTIPSVRTSNVTLTLRPQLRPNGPCGQASESWARRSFAMSVRTAHCDSPHLYTCPIDYHVYGQHRLII